MKSGLLAVYLVLLIITGTAAQAVAQQREIRLGHLHIAPSLELQEVYDDNIFYSEGSDRPTEKMVSDWITHIKPGLLLDYMLTGTRGAIKLGYAGDFARYAQNSFNDWRTNKILLDIDYLAPGGLIVKIKNLFTDAEDPYGSLNEFGLGRKTKRWTNDFESRLGFKFSDRFKILTFYNFFKQRYDDRLDFTQNYQSPEIGIGSEVKLAEKTWVFLRSYTGRQNYTTHRAGVTNSNDASYDWKKVTTGLTWDSEARFEGEFNIGYQWNSYDNSRDRNNRVYNDTSSWIAATSIDFKQSENRTLRLNVKRSFQQLSAGQNGYFTNTAIALNLQQKIRSRFLLLAGCGYTKNNYDSSYAFYKDRKDGIRTVKTSLKYLLSSWLAMGVGYQYLHNDSNNDRSDYRINRISITLDINPAYLHKR